MASFRRSVSLVHHDKIVQNGDSGSGTSPSPKQPRSRIYLLLREYGSPLVLLMVFDWVRAAIAGIFRRRSCRPVDRSKMKGQHRNQGFFHLFVFFILGIVLGFAPYLSGDVSKNFVSKRHAFSFEGDLVTASGNQAVSNMVSSPESFVSEHVDGSGQVATSKLRDETFEPSPIPSDIEESVLEYQKLLIIITLTNASALQAYYLNRLAHILRNVSPSLLWIVVEMPLQSTETAEILRETGVMYRHLVCAQNVTSIKEGHAHQRNVALSHIEKHRLDGIVYFADADRIYSTEVFDQMREIRRFGTWPVAILAENKNKVMVEGPVCGDTQVMGWHTSQRSKSSKRFHIDVSGFAFNSTILWDPKSWRRPTIEAIRLDDTVEEGLQVSTFIEQLVEDESQMEGLPNNCSKIMVWRLHLEAPEVFYPPGWSMLKNLEAIAPLT